MPKYFGDAASGSAYVLYYQAVDLDLSALGLRPPESESAAASTSAPADSSVSQISTLATTLEADESTSNSPALPPGLTPEDHQTPSPRPDRVRRARTTLIGARRAAVVIVLCFALRRG